ncbi:MAG: glycosyltransferase family 39 protein [Candidatus Omnitrophota bacterium]|nr:glycosyltransferase family 39 protein [Candidatus Omnitrophota bacterium]
MKTKIVVALLFAIFAGLAISSMLQQSGTCDEIAHHIPVGVVMMTKGDLKLDTSQPPLSRYITALPVVLFLNPRLPQNRAEWRTDDRASFGRDFFFKYNNHPKQMLFASRLMIVFVGLLCGLVVFLWSRSLFGLKTALFSLFLYVFSPDILAHTQLATTDMAATFFILLSIYIFWRFVNNQNNFNLTAAGISLGLAQLSKYSALILYPIFILLFIFVFPKIKQQKGKNILLQALLIFMISIIVVWGGYGFRLEPVLKDAMRQNEKLELINAKVSSLPFWNENAKNKLDNFLLHVPVPLGEHILGTMGIFRHEERGHRTYFLGTWSEKGNILYFAVAFLIKMPIPIIFFLATGLFVCLCKKSSPENYFLILPPLVYFIVALLCGLQIGVRHLLPMYPFCFMIAARSISLARYKSFAFILILVSLWYAVSSYMIWPHYLSYFNESVGGPNNGWKYLRDSNIDWGQDLPALGEYIKKNNINEISFLYFGQDNPSLYGINFKKFSNEEFIKPENRVYAVSVQCLDSITWTKNLSPTAKAGYSIFIYDFRK